MALGEGSETRRQRRLRIQSWSTHVQWGEQIPKAHNLDEKKIAGTEPERKHQCRQKQKSREFLRQELEARQRQRN